MRPVRPNIANKQIVRRITAYFSHIFLDSCLVWATLPIRPISTASLLCLANDDVAVDRHEPRHPQQPFGGTHTRWVPIARAGPASMCRRPALSGGTTSRLCHVVPRLAGQSEVSSPQQFMLGKRPISGAGKPQGTRSDTATLCHFVPRCRRSMPCVPARPSPPSTWQCVLPNQRPEKSANEPNRGSGRRSPSRHWRQSVCYGSLGGKFVPGRKIGEQRPLQ